MAVIQIAYNAATKVATVQTKGDAPPTGSTVLQNNITHNATGDVLESGVNHVLYHHVQDALYKIGQLDMQSVRIDLDIVYTALTALSSTPATVTLAVAATQQITNTFTPPDASNKTVTYTTSAPTKATVNASGLITAVATGSATITVTSADGAFTDTVVVTIS